MISFKVTKEESILIDRLARRAIVLLPGEEYLDIVMDIEAVHANGCPLNLEELLKTSDEYFVYDICGIIDNLDRKDESLTAGELLNGFIPRTASHMHIF